MFSAIYLVCFPSEPCKFFVDSFPYTTQLECESGAENNIVRNTLDIMNAGLPVPTVEYQCVNWSKA